MLGRFQPLALPKRPPRGCEEVSAKGCVAAYRTSQQTVAELRAAKDRFGNRWLLASLRNPKRFVLPQEHHEVASWLAADDQSPTPGFLTRPRPDGSCLLMFPDGHDPMLLIFGGGVE